MMHSFTFHGICLLLMYWSLFTVQANTACADARIVTKAMEASTIAELFIEKGKVRVELEIGSADVSAFQNIYPDNLYEKLFGSLIPLDDRLSTFFEYDWVMHADGELMLGKPTRAIVDKRVVRDEVTGEPLPDQPDDAEFVIRLSLEYALGDQPATLAIRPPQSHGSARATVGFICYHNGLPVNDFRYLSDQVTLDLDWQDPWYSRFRHKNLRRQYDAPLSAFLYVEPYEVRQEIIVRPRDLEHWIDLEIGEDGMILVEQQEDLKRKVASFLSNRNQVSIDGRTAEGKLDRIHFVRRSLRTTGIIEPPVELDANSATLGVIFVYPIDSLPNEVEMRWEMFSPKIQAIPAVASDEAGGLPSEMTPDNPALLWKNYLKNPTSTDLRTIEQIPARQQIELSMLSIFCGCLAIGAAGVLYQNKSAGISKMPCAILACSVIGGVLALPVTNVKLPFSFSSLSEPTDSESRELLTTLLYNVYRAFEHHDESLIYDRLSQSIDGDLLSEVYLETRRSIEIKNQGGLRISVKQVEVKTHEFIDNANGGSRYTCRWIVSGAVGHWGHIHQRQNEHFAYITLAPRDGQWKITAMEMLDEHSMQPSNPAEAKEGRGA